MHLIDIVKEKLSSKFKVKDLGQNFLVIDVTRNNSGILIGQKSYTQRLLSNFNLSDCNPTVLLAEANRKLIERTKVEDPVDQTMYRSAILGSLLYLANMTRQD